MRIRKTAVILVVVACIGMAACVYRREETMWDAVKQAASQEYQSAELSITSDEADIRLTEITYLDHKYYMNLDPLADYLSKEGRFSMRLAAAVIPREEWIGFTIDDISKLYGLFHKEEWEAKDEIKNPRKLAVSLAVSIYPVIKEVCGGEQFVSRQGDQFILTIDKDAVIQMRENTARIEKKGSRITKTVEAAGDAIERYGSESMAAMYHPWKERVLSWINRMKDSNFDGEPVMQGKVFSIENKKDSVVLKMSKNGTDMSQSYELELTKAGVKEVEMPEKTIEIHRLVDRLKWFGLIP